MSREEERRSLPQKSSTEELGDFTTTRGPKGVRSIWGERLPPLIGEPEFERLEVFKEG